MTSAEPATSYQLTNQYDGTSLFVRHWQAEGKLRARLAIVHGFAEHSGRYEAVAHAFAGIGCEVHALDLRTHGRSPRVLARQAANVRGAAGLLADVSSLLRQLHQREPARPVAALGHSMGGLLLCRHLLSYGHPGVDYLMLSSPYLRGVGTPPLALAPLLAGAGWLLPTLPSGERVNPQHISQLPEEVAAYKHDPLNYTGNIGLGIASMMIVSQAVVQRKAQALRVPFYIIHGDADKIADIRGSEMLVAQAASSDKRLESFVGGYHELFHDVEQQRAISSLVSWLDSRLPAS